MLKNHWKEEYCQRVRSVVKGSVTEVNYPQVLRFHPSTIPLIDVSFLPYGHFIPGDEELLILPMGMGLS